MPATNTPQTRRTFAIISHPDAGKTTLTEKLLLYANAIHLGGAIKAKRTSRHTVSDWMEMERERGISITSSVLQFSYQKNFLNLLDTPGHADFSEDTYRTLAAVDSALMLIDHAKGIEVRTQKLFDVCRMRSLPVITFMNKLDRNGKEPLELIQEVSDSLNIKVKPMNWPIGMGGEFYGVVNLQDNNAYLFTAGDHGTKKINLEILPFKECKDKINSALFDKVSEEIELLSLAGDEYDHDSFLKGDISPIFWGSAMTNFGIEPLLNFIAHNSASPGARKILTDEMIFPNDTIFSGFIFKIQANMNPRHRDRIAFLRVVSGEFNRSMEVYIARTNEHMKLSKPHSFMAEERSIVEQAWAGDIVGFHDPGKLRIGDTLSSKKNISFIGIPRFAPEYFVQIKLNDPLKRKALDKGLHQLSHEGVIQIFYTMDMSHHNAFLGAVGLLQFEVLKERLKNEYNVNIQLVSTSYRFARWVGGSQEALNWLKKRNDYILLKDRNQQFVLLSNTKWPLDYALENAPNLKLFDVEPL